MSILSRLRSIFTKRACMHQPTTGTRMDPTFVAALKAEAERNAGDPYPQPAPDYCDVAWNENPKLTVKQRRTLKAVR